MTRYLRAVLAVLVGVIAAVIMADPAQAHTSATVEPAVAGAQNATISFNAAAESTTAGITSLKIVLPQGLTAADLTYVDGPAGWAMRPDADGYVVSGPAVAVGRDVQHRVRAKQLPMTPTLVFKVLQTYTDGRIDRWIEIPSAANAQPEYPAPVVELAAPPGGFPSGGASTGPKPASTDHGAADAPAASTTSAPVDPSNAAGEDGGGSPLPWIVLAVVVLALVAGGAYVVNRRKRVTSS
ncbi:DUF1775 domain-containing protein [Virgisporangium ochraceum]|uniref:DUF1775 domain-containing protein n=1 Tax=Virgisporangium ochraceum TaxID=65505 RepID=UPI001941DEB1|nr:DUF1775 domain-containing protein [Virgisporangium ochraceum]